MEQNRIVKAENQGTIFRGFEIMLEGRDPLDAPYLTQRICGICSSAYGVASCRALEDIAGVQPPDNALLTRNIILGLDTIQNHLRQFYMLYLWDWVAPPPQNPFKGGYTRDYRLPAGLTARFRERYWAGVDFARQAHEALALLGGKIPHTHGIVPGGVSLVPTGDLARELDRRVKKIGDFLEHCYCPDTLLLQQYYPEYMEIGKGSPNYISHGFFPEPRQGDVFPAGAALEGQKEELSLELIEENQRYSWYRGNSGPPHGGKTVPDPDRPGAYSWTRAPRYRGLACQGGPLARRIIRGDRPPGGNAVMDRMISRAEEALEIS
ncbi:MAG TPA: nickel-dependent hydrogenase large subunit, partial [Bacillota bacterium]|nr:nickel-dependent hydrogenase large subunit [Bacillota bacterium]